MDKKLAFRSAYPLACGGTLLVARFNELDALTFGSEAVYPCTCGGTMPQRKTTEGETGLSSHLRSSSGGQGFRFYLAGCSCGCWDILGRAVFLLQVWTLIGGDNPGAMIHRPQGYRGRHSRWSGAD